LISEGGFPAAAAQVKPRPLCGLSSQRTQAARKELSDEPE